MLKYTKLMCMLNRNLDLQQFQTNCVASGEDRDIKNICQFPLSSLI